MANQVGFINKEEHMKYFECFIPDAVLKEISSPKLVVIGATKDNASVGALVAELRDTEASIRSVCVDDKMRHEGIGTALVSKLIRFLRRTTIQTLYTVLADADDSTRSFFESVGLRESEKNTCYRTTVGKMSGSRALIGKSSKTKSLSEIPKGLFSSFAARIFTENPRTVSPDMFDGEVSRVYLENGKVEGMILVAAEENLLSIEWLANASDNNLVPMYLFKDACAEAVAKYSEETVVEYTSILDVSAKLSDAILGTDCEKSVSYVYELPSYTFRLYSLEPSKWEEQE